MMTSKKEEAPSAALNAAHEDFQKASAAWQALKEQTAKAEKAVNDARAVLTEEQRRDRAQRIASAQRRREALDALPKAK